MFKKIKTTIRNWISNKSFFELFLIVIVLAFIGYTVLMITTDLDWWSKLGNTYGTLNSFVSTVTLVALIMTLYMTAENNSLGIRPLINIEILCDSNGKYLKLQNTGNGTAVNLTVNPIEIDEKLKIRLDFVPNNIAMLAVNESKQIKFIPISCDSKTTFPFEANIDPDYANQNYELLVTFQDLNFKQFTQKFSVGSGGVRLTELNGKRF